MGVDAKLIQPPFGDLDWNHEMRWWERDGFALPLFSGATVELYVPPALAAREPLPIPQVLIDAAGAMLALGPEALDEIVPHVWQTYLDAMKAGAGHRGFPELAGPADVWGAVRPYTLTVEQFDNSAWLIFELDCDWAPEDGLQLVLKGGARWVRVSPYDGQLTDGRAAGDPSLDAWMADPATKLPIRVSL